MKKLWTLLLCVVMIFSLAACGGDKKEEDNASDYTYEIGFLTASSDISIDDGDRIEAAWNGVRQFAEENDKTYKYYEPAEANKKSQLDRLDEAMKEGVKIIVAVGPEMKEVMAEAQKKYGDLKFIYLDGELSEIEKNCVTIRFDALQAGFLAGYGAVIDGLGNIAFLADGKTEEAVDFGYGFLQGCNEAAMRYGRYAVIDYNYGSKDNTEKEIRDIAKKWYEGGKTAVFAYGADVFDAVKEEAEKADKKVIGAGSTKNYSNTVVTSARKCYEEAVFQQLETVYDGSFAGGKNLNMNAKNNGIGLDMKASKFQYFNQDMYKDIYKRISNGEMEILSAKDKDAKTIEDLIKAKWMYYIRVQEQ